MKHASTDDGGRAPAASYEWCVPANRRRAACWANANTRGTVSVKDLNDFAKLNAVYGGCFKDKPPARATVQMQRLPKDVAVEISAIAVR